jgi:hypothetical protein
VIAHEPVIREFEGSVAIGCECGWLDPYLWSHQVGARTAWLNHVVTAHFPASWPGSFSVDYDDEGRLS